MAKIRSPYYVAPVSCTVDIENRIMTESNPEIGGGLPGAEWGDTV